MMHKMVANRDLELSDGRQVLAGGSFVAPTDEARKDHERAGDARHIDADPNPPPRTERRRDAVKADTKAEPAKADLKIAEPAKTEPAKADAPKASGKDK